MVLYNLIGGETERLKVFKRTADEAVPSSTRSPAGEVNNGATQRLAPATSFVSQTSNDEHQGYSEQSLEEQPELTGQSFIYIRGCIVETRNSVYLVLIGLLVPC